MKYARKMMVVPFNTPVGSSADAQNVNMSVALMKNIPNNEKTKMYLQSLSKLREMSETLRPEDKFKETVSKLIQNIEEEVKKDNFATEDIELLEKKEYQDNASKKVTDYSSSNDIPKKSKRQSNKISNRELVSLNVNNILDNSDKKLTRGARARALAVEAKANNELKQSTAEIITPSNSESDNISKNLIDLKKFDTKTTKSNESGTNFRLQLEDSLIEELIAPPSNNKKRKLLALSTNHQIAQEKSNLVEKISINQQQLQNQNISNIDYRDSINVTDDEDDEDDEYVDANNAYLESEKLDASKNVIKKLSKILDKSVTEFGSEKVATALNRVFKQGTPTGASRKIQFKPPLLNTQTEQLASMFVPISK